VALGVVDRIDAHPLRRLLSGGLTVTIGSGDYSLLDRSVADQLTSLSSYTPWVYAPSSSSTPASPHVL